MSRFHLLMSGFPVKYSTVFLSIAIGLFSCKPRSNSSQIKDSSLGSLERCVALRGNGTHIVSHITSLAKITSEWGVVDAAAGGSSATITTFMYESMRMNPAIKGLDEAKKREAISLLLKSLIGFADELVTAPEWLAAQSSVIIAKKLLDGGVFDIPTTEVSKIATSLKSIFQSNDIRALINPEVIKMLDPLASESSYGGHQNRVLEVRKAALSLTNLDATDADVFFRPGVINFPYFIEMIGRVADFYAGRGVERLEFDEFLRNCSEGSRTLLWSELAKQKSGNLSCGQRFSQIVQAWRKAYEGKESSRLKEVPGLGMRSIAITSVVDSSKGIEALKSYDKLYVSGAKRKLDFTFDDVKFGYWISKGFAPDLIDAWRKSSNDAKAQRSKGLGVANSWQEILEKSPREPSLGRYVEFAKEEPAAGSISLGGWADLHPVQVLRFAGCKEIIYLTRRTGETTFITKGQPFVGRARFGLAELLGMSETEYNAIYNLENQASSYSGALRETNGVWCTDWNKFSAKEQRGIALDGWNAPLVTKFEAFTQWPQADASGRKILGCN